MPRRGPANPGETMNQVAILYPVFVQVLLVFAVGVAMAQAESGRAYWTVVLGAE